MRRGQGAQIESWTNPVIIKWCEDLAKRHQLCLDVLISTFTEFLTLIIGAWCLSLMLDACVVPIE